MAKKTINENAEKVEVESTKSLVPAKSEGKTLCVVSVSRVNAKEGKFGANYEIVGDCFIKSEDGVIQNAKKLFLPYAMNAEFEGRESEYKGKRLVFTVVSKRDESTGKLRVTGYIKTSGFDSAGIDIPPEMIG